MPQAYYGWSCAFCQPAGRPSHPTNRLSASVVCEQRPMSATNTTTMGTSSSSMASHMASCRNLLQIHANESPVHIDLTPGASGETRFQTGTTQCQFSPAPMPGEDAAPDRGRPNLRAIVRAAVLCRSRTASMTPTVSIAGRRIRPSSCLSSAH